jgi:hypothetical protein
MTTHIETIMYFPLQNEQKCIFQGDCVLSSKVPKT